MMQAPSFDEIIDRYGAERSSLIAMLQDIQTQEHYLPREALVQVAQRIEVPLSQVYRVATFYRAFSLQPRGKHLIRVCMGTACHLRGAPLILEAMEREMDLTTGETSSDNLFTLETVNCLGACALAPVVVVGDTYYRQVRPEQVVEILNTYRK